MSRRLFPLKPVLIFFAASILISCASSDMNKPKGIEALKDDPRLGKQVSRLCFKGGIDGFSDPIDNTIVLRESLDSHYRVSLSGLCPNLQNAQSIAFEKSSGCARRGDHLLISESVFSLDDGIGLGPDRCFINEIYEWDRNAKDEAVGMSE